MEILYFSPLKWLSDAYNRYKNDDLQECRGYPIFPTPLRSSFSTAVLFNKADLWFLDSTATISLPMSVTRKPSLTPRNKNSRS